MPQLSRQIPTAASRVRSQFRSCGICGGRSGTGTGFLRVLRFSLPIHIPLIAPTKILSLAGTIGQLVADVLNGFRPTPTHKLKKKNRLTFTEPHGAIFQKNLNK
jgi:hypothetical protein